MLVLSSYFPLPLVVSSSVELFAGRGALGGESLRGLQELDFRDLCVYTAPRHTFSLPSSIKEFRRCLAAMSLPLPYSS
ncbi:hypothetical protein SRHO_G00204800 [Serrasalmus rhombeus]